MRYRFFALILLIFAIGFAFAEGTPEDTVICNSSYVTYTGSRGIISYEAWSDSACITVAFDASVLIIPDHLLLTGYLENSVYFPHRVFNLGNGPDTIDIDGVNENGWPVTIIVDQDYDGILDPEDLEYNPNVTEIAMDDSLGIFIQVDIGSDDADWGILSETEVVATSRRTPTVADTAFDTILVVGPQIELILEADPDVPDMVGAADLIDYTLSAKNSDADTARQAVDITFTIPRHEDIDIVDAPIPSPGWLVEYYDAGWSATFTADADSFRFRLPTTDTMATGDSLVFTWQGEVVECPVDSLISARVHGMYHDTTATHAHDYIIDSDTVYTGVTSPDVTIELDTLLYGNVGDTIIYEMTISNNGDVTDQFLIDLIAGAWGDHPIYVTDCDGTLEAGEMADEDSITGTILSGASSCITILVAVPDTEVVLNDTCEIIVTSTENLCIADTLNLIFNQIIPRIIVNKDIIDEFGDFTDTDDSVLPSDTIEYAIKFWNVQMGLADSVVILDTLDYYTPLIEGIPEAEFKYRLPDDASNLADWVIDYSIDNGSSWIPYNHTTPNLVATPEGSGDPVILRIRETSVNKIQPAATPPAPGTEDDADGQAEFRFKVQLR